MVGSVRLSTIEPYVQTSPNVTQGRSSVLLRWYHDTLCKLSSGIVDVTFSHAHAGDTIYRFNKKTRWVTLSRRRCRVVNKKLSYRRGIARRAVTVKAVLNVAQIFVELHLIGLSPLSSIRQMTVKVIQGHWKWHE